MRKQRQGSYIRLKLFPWPLRALQYLHMLSLTSPNLTPKLPALQMQSRATQPDLRYCLHFLQTRSSARTRGSSSYCSHSALVLCHTDLKQSFSREYSWSELQLKYPPYVRWAPVTEFVTLSSSCWTQSPIHGSPFPACPDLPVAALMYSLSNSDNMSDCLH